VSRNAFNNWRSPPRRATAAIERSGKTPEQRLAVRPEQSLPLIAELAGCGGWKKELDLRRFRRWRAAG
jgi:hypothetical protein